MEASSVLNKEPFKREAHRLDKRVSQEASNSTQRGSTSAKKTSIKMLQAESILPIFTSISTTSKEQKEDAAEEVIEQVVDEEAHGPQDERGNKQDAGDEEAGVETDSATDMIRRHRQAGSIAVRQSRVR